MSPEQVVFSRYYARPRNVENGCRIWDGKKYPRVWVKGKNYAVHRVVLEKKLGRKIKPGYFSLHRCNNDKCVERSHLYEGTQHQNMQDRLRAGRYARGRDHPLVREPSRAARGDENGSRKHPERLQRGVERPAAKLTEEKVREARKRYAAGEGTIRELARQYGVTYTPMQLVLDNKAWKHVT